MIYFIRAGDDGPIKIGTTSDVKRRLRALQTSVVERLHLIRVVGGGHRRENAIHRAFAKDWLRGEWFRPSPELLAWIEALPAEDGPQPAEEHTLFDLDPIIGAAVEMDEDYDAPEGKAFPAFVRDAFSRPVARKVAAAANVPLATAKAWIGGRFTPSAEALLTMLHNSEEVSAALERYIHARRLARADAARTSSDGGAAASSDVAMARPGEGR